MTRCLSDVGLKHVGKRPVRAFSCGMRRRLGIARLILCQPELILLDEPFNQLDDDGVEMVQRFLGDFLEAGRTLVLALHDAHRVSSLATNHLTLKAGRCV